MIQVIIVISHDDCFTQFIIIISRYFDGVVLEALAVLLQFTSRCKLIASSIVKVWHCIAGPPPFHPPTHAHHFSEILGDVLNLPRGILKYNLKTYKRCLNRAHFGTFTSFVLVLFFNPEKSSLDHSSELASSSSLFLRDNLDPVVIILATLPYLKVPKYAKCWSYISYSRDLSNERKCQTYLKKCCGAKQIHW